MNKEYIRLGDNAIIEDDLGNKRIIPYNENLDEILVQENLVEQIEKKISFFQSKVSKAQDKKSKEALFDLIMAIITFLIAPMALSKLAGVLLGDVYLATQGFSISTFLGVYLTIACVPLAAILTHKNYKEYKDYNRKKKGVKNAIEKLTKELEKEKEKLNKLKSKNKSVDEKEVEVTKVKSHFNDLDSRILVYRDCGTNGQKYYNYYFKNGKLPQELANKYNEEEQDLVKEYLEEKGPTLTKKYKPRSK